MEELEPLLHNVLSLEDVCKGETWDKLSAMIAARPFSHLDVIAVLENYKILDEQKNGKGIIPAYLTVEEITKLVEKVYRVRSHEKPYWQAVIDGNIAVEINNAMCEMFDNLQVYKTIADYIGVQPSFEEIKKTLMEQCIKNGFITEKTTIGRQIQKAKGKMSQNKFAEKAGISKSWASEISNNEDENPTLDTLEALSDAGADIKVN